MKNETAKLKRQTWDQSNTITEIINTCEIAQKQYMETNAELEAKHRE